MVNVNNGSVAHYGDIYHEKQRLQLCALHALNNLLQRPVFTRHQLDAICDRLVELAPHACRSSSSWWGWRNPHRSPLAIGNYDVNVVTEALQTVQLQLVWFDRRRGVACLIPERIFGFVVNRLLRRQLGTLTLPVTSRHWLCLRSLPLPGADRPVDSSAASSTGGSQSTPVSQQQQQQQCRLTTSATAAAAAVSPVTCPSQGAAATATVADDVGEPGGRSGCSAVQSGNSGSSSGGRNTPTVCRSHSLLSDSTDTVGAASCSGSDCLPSTVSHSVPLSADQHESKSLYYNLDSKLPKPRLIGDRSALLEYLDKLLQDTEVQLFIVLNADVKSSGSWLSSDD